MIALERRVKLAHQLDGALVLSPDDHAVRSHEVFDGGAFFEELGIADDAEFEFDAARCQRLGDGGPHLVRGTHRHGALVDHHLVVGHVVADVAGGGQHVLQVG